jgi:hypothetical protein
MENTKKAKRIPPNKKYDSVDMLDAVDRDLQAVMKSIEVYDKTYPKLRDQEKWCLMMESVKAAIEQLSEVDNPRLV